jgi:hypothetical protein
MNPILRLVPASLLAFLFLIAPAPGCAAELTKAAPAQPYSLKPIASFANYGLYQSSPFFSSDGKARRGQSQLLVSSPGLASGATDHFGQTSNIQDALQNLGSLNLRPY